MLEIGSVVGGKYKILNEIGHGGMSTVYLAINSKANKTWAVKEVRKAGVRDFEIVKQSLITETELLKKLKHPNLPSIIDIIDDDENLLIVMDYIEGITMDRILQEEGAQSQDRVLLWAEQLCDVLGYLHRHNPPIIYRDMKPSNVMVKSDDSIVLIDFGTAREYDNRKNVDTVCLGTRGYAAPEQFGSMGQTDARTDIYCLGVTMYQMLTGHNPTKPPYEIYPIRYWDKDLSSGLEHIILNCTKQNPDERYQTTDELRYELKNYKSFDDAEIARKERKVKRFWCLLSMTIFTGLMALICRIMGHGMLQKDYEYIIGAAQKNTNHYERLEGYVKAIELTANNPKAYRLLYDELIQDGVFSVQEEKILLQLSMVRDDFLLELKKKKPFEYADFCYDIGNAYWYYYEHEENRQVSALNWYEAADEIYNSSDERVREHQRCLLYIETGKFYKQIMPAQIVGSDEGMYREYWHSMVGIKRINDENPDRDLQTIRMYQELIIKSAEYASFLMEDGVEEQEILKIYEEIYLELDHRNENILEKIYGEVKTTYKMLEDSEKIIRSTYEKEKNE